jgi:exonuclease SbcD
VFRFLHAADIHLDSPLCGLARYQGAPLNELQGATRKAFTNLVSEAIQRQVQLLLIAGDLFDGDWPDYNTGLFYLLEMGRLERAGVQVVTLAGNHDAQSKISRSLRLPSNVHTLPVEQPGSVVLEEHQVIIHGQGFAEAATTQDLTKNYPDPVEGYFNVGMLHTSADGRPGHDHYAPCSVETLKNFGYDYWALGHVHQREVLCQDPWILFSGNLQGRHVKELGARGATLVSVDQGKVVEVEELVLDVLRWYHLCLDISAVESDEDFLSLLERELLRIGSEAQGRFIALRVESVGEGLFHSRLSGELEYFTAEIRNLCNLSGHGVWFEKLKTSSRSPILGCVDNGSRSDLLGGIRARLGRPECLEEVGRELFDGLLSKLPRVWRTGEMAFEPTEVRYLEDALDDALALLEQRLGGLEGTTS